MKSFKYQTVNLSKDLKPNITYQTNDYNMFVLPSDEYRFSFIKKKYIKRLKEFKKNGQLCAIEIYWDIKLKKYFILDGLYRFIIMQKLNLPIIFTIIKIKSIQSYYMEKMNKMTINISIK